LLNTNFFIYIVQLSFLKTIYIGVVSIFLHDGSRGFHLPFRVIMMYVSMYLLICCLLAGPGFISYSQSVGSEADFESCGEHICNTISCVSGEELWYGYVFMCVIITSVCLLAVYDMEHIRFQHKKERNFTGGRPARVFERSSYIFIFCAFQMTGWFPQNCHSPLSSFYHIAGVSASLISGILLTIYFLVLVTFKTTCENFRIWFNSFC
jgi:hypothetical protein